MICSRWFGRRAAGILLLGAGLLAGCAPDGNRPLDEQKESNYLRGKRLTVQMDYQGAIDAYEKALQANPRSASAHFEAALLYEGDAHDPAAAVYHYQRFLRLAAPTDSRTDQARDHLNQCMMDLARSVSSLMVLPPSAQGDFEKIAQENRDLKARLARLEAAEAARAAAVPTNPPTPNPQSVTATNPVSPPAEIARVATARAAPPPAPQPPSGRTYVVRPNDTLAAIARKYGTTISALQTANPRVEALRLQVGSTLLIPAP